jgi:hypothetical protein
MYIQTNDYRLETYKGQTQPLIRKGTPQRQDSNFQTATLEQEAISGQSPKIGSTPRYNDWLTVRRKWLWFRLWQCSYAWGLPLCTITKKTISTAVSSQPSHCNLYNAHTFTGISIYTWRTNMLILNALHTAQKSPTF